MSTKSNFLTVVQLQESFPKVSATTGTFQTGMDQNNCKKTLVLIPWCKFDQCSNPYDLTVRITAEGA